MQELETNWFQWLSLATFAVAVIHTFSTKFFERLANKYPEHSGIYHLLGEVEAVFGFWSMILMFIMYFGVGKIEAVQYMDSRSYIEPLFVFAIMVIAGTRPILRMSMILVQGLAKILPLNASLSFFIITLFFVPILGSLITEPAAMTVAALILRDRFYSSDIPNRLKYAALGVLFVNVSIGGTLTAYAAPPVLMVAKTWGWDSVFMFTNFGWKAMVACAINTGVLAWWFNKEISSVPVREAEIDDRLPFGIIIVHLLFLVAVVIFAHHPPIFLGFLLFFLGVATAYKRYQTRLILREGLLVAFFLAGLVVLGGLQQWWLEPLLTSMSPSVVYYGATGLTAITDNAALTYLGSLVVGLSDSFKYALVAGAVTGGGLTVIANAPNPAGFAILRKEFDDNVISPLGLLKSALLPTIVAAMCFQLL